MAVKKCDICGKNSGFFPLCKEHNEMKEKGFVIKNEKTGKWELKKENLKKNNTCIICGAETKNNYIFCKECYYNLDEREEELDKNMHPQKLKDYYFNSLNYALRIYDESKIYYQKLTMSAISNFIEKMYKDNSLTERLSDDLLKINKNLLEKNQKLKNTIKEENKISKIITDKTNQIASTIRTQDSHWVQSELECKVDDILFNLNVVHAYEIKVNEITERAVYCDWYIPVTLDKGIYIELWGMNDNKEYNENREEKVELYKKHKLKLIELEAYDIKQDTQQLISKIRQSIDVLKNEIYEELKR